MSRTSDLEALRADLQARMSVAESDQNFAVMGRLLVDVLKQLEDANGPAASGPAKGSVLSEFETKLRERESGAKAPRRAKG